MNDLEIIKRFISDNCPMASDRECSECEMKCKAFETAERMANRIAELEQASCDNCKHAIDLTDSPAHAQCAKECFDLNGYGINEVLLDTSRLKCSEWEASSGS